MAIGQKRPPVTDEQRRAFDAKLKQDALSFARDLLKPAVMGAADHIKKNPDSMVSQVAREPFVVAVAVHGLRAVSRLYDERDAADASADAGGSAAGGSTAGTASNQARVVDAEFVEDEPK